MDIKGESVPLGTHICSVYRYIKEKVLLTFPFLIYAFENNQKCIYIGDEVSRNQLLEWLLNKNFDTNKLIDSGQLTLLDNTSVYLKDGNFDQNEVIKNFKLSIQAALDHGFDSVFIAGELPFANGKTLSAGDLISYESSVDKFISTSKSIAMCHYNEAGYDRSTLINIIKSHKKVAIYGQLYDNKYYLRSETELPNYDALINSIIESS